MDIPGRVDHRFRGQTEVGFQFLGWTSAVLRGGYVGLSWAGIWLWTWFILAAPQRLSRQVPGLGSPFALQALVLIVGGFSEEFWRVTGITALLHDRYSPRIEARFEPLAGDHAARNHVFLGRNRHQRHHRISPALNSGTPCNHFIQPLVIVQSNKTKMPEALPEVQSPGIQSAPRLRAHT
jgi:hypothetical protein